jgi:hypothetical protein
VEREAQSRAEETRLRELEEKQYATDESVRIGTKREAACAADEWGQQTEDPRVVTQPEALREADDARSRAQPTHGTSLSELNEAPITADKAAVLEAPVAAVVASPRKPAAQRRSPQYRPPSGAEPTPGSARPTSVNNGADVDATRTAPTARAISIEVRVLFDRGGSCRVTLLPRRRDGLPDECAVTRANGSSLELIALEDEWYQDVAPVDLGIILQTGIVWADGQTGQQWSLAGREIFVLAAGTTHRGFVSCSRLMLGREHVVLCATSTLAVTEEALQTVGCANRMICREEDGAPSGWVVICDVDKFGRPRGLVPTCSVPQIEGGNILNALRPLPDVQISLEGGVSLGHNSWLAGFPPLIRVLGEAQHVQRVLIDGQEATIGDDGAFHAPGWDTPGTHQIWCPAGSRRYSLARLQRSWNLWPAHRFAATRAGGHGLVVCGPLIRSFARDDAFEAAATGFLRGDVLQNNPILLGAVPGQVFTASLRQDVRGACGFAAPPFEPIWALPLDPLRCDKGRRVLLVGDPNSGPRTGGQGSPSLVSQWCRLILDANRKRLLTDPEARTLWAQYTRLARNIWRGTR